MNDNSEEHDTGPSSPQESTFDDEMRDALRTFVEDSIETEYAAEQHSPTIIFDLLSNPGRRYVLTYLLQSDGFVTISELVDYVLTKTSARMTDDEFRRKVTTELSHTHLPRLDEEGFVRYNMERQLIIPTEKTRLAEPYLRLALLQTTLAREKRDSVAQSRSG